MSTVTTVVDGVVDVVAITALAYLATTGRGSWALAALSGGIVSVALGKRVAMYKLGGVP